MLTVGVTLIAHKVPNLHAILMSQLSFSPARAKAQKLTTPQVAERYQVTVRTIQNWREQGIVPFLKITPRCIRYDAAAVDRALAKGAK